MLEAMTRNWGALAFRGAVAIVFGILAILWPGATVRVFVILLATFALVEGLINVVVGIRGRGVTFTGQTETGEIQVIATANAKPGRLAFLRLEAVGTVEDQPVFRGSRFLELEITE